MAERASGRDDVVTLLAIGILAYVGETVGHEALGHGGACFATGGVMTALAPLWMRCSVQAPVMVLAGPAFNFIAAAVFAFVLARRRTFGATGLFLWLSSAFNALVAFGYLIVGGAAGFGDWPALLAGPGSTWAWRVGSIAVGLGGYLLALRGLSVLYARRADTARLAWRALAPAAGAALVAFAAEVIGGRASIATIALVLGCTLFVGWSLYAAGKGRPSDGQDCAIAASPGWIIAGLAVAAVFVLWIGPVARFGG